MLSLKSFIVGLALATATALPSLAGELAPAKGPVILTVTGAITTTNADKSAVFDKAMLDALPSRVSKVETPWTEGVTSFEGPLGKALLEAVGSKGTTLHVVALDDYAVDIPAEDFVKYPVILATKKNGVPMPVRDKGPIFVIYPFDTDKALFSEAYFNRSVWQVKSIDIR